LKEEADAIQLMHAALDAGITFFDNAWDYHEGRSEELMGKALVGGKRDKVFLMTKNCARDAAGTRQHLEDSLRRLQNRPPRLWQFHEINYDNDPECWSKRGRLPRRSRPRRRAKSASSAYTGHKSPHILKAMLPLHAWDTCQLPINVSDHHYRSFRHELLPELLNRNIGPIGMKSLGGGNMEAGGKIVAAGVAPRKKRSGTRCRSRSVR